MSERPTRAEMDARLAKKWHLRDCGCDDPGCGALAKALDRARLISDTIGAALRKRFDR